MQTSKLLIISSCFQRESWPLNENKSKFLPKEVEGFSQSIFSGWDKEHIFFETLLPCNELIDNTKTFD